MTPDNIDQTLEFIWIPIVTALVLLWRKYGGIDTRTQLLEQAQDFYDKLRDEDRELRSTQYDTVIDKLDSLETRIKNGG